MRIASAASMSVSATSQPQVKAERDAIDEAMRGVLKGAARGEVTTEAREQLTRAVRRMEREDMLTFLKDVLTKRLYENGLICRLDDRADQQHVQQLAGFVVTHGFAQASGITGRGETFERYLQVGHDRSNLLEVT